MELPPPCVLGAIGGLCFAASNWPASFDFPPPCARRGANAFANSGLTSLGLGHCLALARFCADGMYWASDAVFPAGFRSPLMFEGSTTSHAWWRTGASFAESPPAKLFLTTGFCGSNSAQAECALRIGSAGGELQRWCPGGPGRSPPAKVRLLYSAPAQAVAGTGTGEGMVAVAVRPEGLACASVGKPQTWLHALPGLNRVAICPDELCPAFNQEVAMAVGRCQDYDVVKNPMVCPECGWWIGGGEVTEVLWFTECEFWIRGVTVANRRLGYRDVTTRPWAWGGRGSDARRFRTLLVDALPTSSQFRSRGTVVVSTDEED
jgi:hypothetical protein